jgi:hypothetical protein
MIRWCPILGAGCIVVLASTHVASACKCAVVSRDRTIASVPVAFEGRIMKIQTEGSAQVTTMTVVRPIKGVRGGATIKVRSRAVSAACGYDFRNAAKKLLVGGQNAGSGSLSVGRCTMFNLNP